MPPLDFRTEVPYRRVHSGEPLRPLVRVRLHHGAATVDALGLVDSGADRTTFSVRLAEVLGIDLSTASVETARGVGGHETVLAASLDITAHGARFLARVNFSPTWTTAFGLLGRADFFRAFRVAFDERAETLFLDPFNEPV